MADDLDLLSLAEAKSALNMASSATGQDTELAAYVTAVSRQLDKLCGPIVNRTITSESHDGGCPALYLRYRPVSSVTTVEEFSSTTKTTLTSESHDTQAANQYLLEKAHGILRRRQGGADALFASGRHNVDVTYVAGRYTSSASVDEKFKAAARLCLTNLWRREQGGGTETFGGTYGTVIPGFGMPNAVMDLLDDEVQAPETG